MPIDNQYFDLTLVLTGTLFYAYTAIVKWVENLYFTAKEIFNFFCIDFFSGRMESIMNNMELINFYNSQSSSNDSSLHTDYTDYSDHMDHNAYNCDLGVHGDCDYTDYTDCDWGGTHGFDGVPDHCTSHDDSD